MITSLLAACSKDQEAVKSSAQQSTRDELVIAYGKDTNAKTENSSVDMTLNIFAGERLVEIIDGKIVPSLAESWEVKDDGRSIVLKLKEGIKFSDGTPMRAETVKKIFDRNLAMDNIHWTEIDRLEKAEVVDEYTIKLSYKEGMQGFIALCGLAEYNNTIMGPATFKTPDDPTSAIVNYTGTGPWKIGEYKKAEYLTLVPNEYYRGSKPKLKKITINVIPSAEARVLAVQSGDVDVVIDYYHGGSDYTPRNMLSTLEQQGFQILKKEVPMTTVLGFNYKKGPWSKNAELRKAFNYAIDKNEVASLFNGWITAANTSYFSSVTPYSSEFGVQQYSYDPEKAKKILKEQGYENASLKMIINSSNPEEVKVGELVQAQLQKVGINLELLTLDSAKYRDTKKTGDFDFYSYYLGGPERRFYTRLDGRFNPDSVEYGSYGGSGCLTTEKITEAVKDSLYSFDEAERKKGFQKVYVALDADAPCVPLYYESIFVVAKPEVKNIEFFSTELNFTNVVIE
jgi:peptide/nickel transport system substrate-binding protein